MTGGEPRGSDDVVYDETTYRVLQLKMQAGGFINYNYVIIDARTRAALIVDPAWEMDRLVATVARHGLSVQGVLQTHSHPDHIHLTREVAAYFSCPVHMHEDEIRFSGFTAPDLRPFADLGTLFVGRTWVTPIHTPGHTPGSTCFLLARTLITGDTLFNEGCGVCHLRGGDPDQMFDSLARLVADVPAPCRVLPGHAFHSLPGLSLHDVQRMNLYIQMPTREKFVKLRMQAVNRKSLAFV